MATLVVEMHGSNSDSVLSELLGPDTLEARPMMLSNGPDTEAIRTWIWVNDRVFLKNDFPTLHQFDQAACLIGGSEIPGLSILVASRLSPLLKSSPSLSSSLRPIR
jgi:hypothetical protein